MVRRKKRRIRGAGGSGRRSLSSYSEAQLVRWFRTNYDKHSFTHHVAWLAAGAPGFPRGGFFTSSIQFNSMRIGSPRIAASARSSRARVPVGWGEEYF